MKKIIYVLSLFIVSFTCLNVFAIDKCTTSEMTRLKELANNVTFDYQYQIEEEIESEEKVFGFYKLKVLNLDSDLKIYYRENNKLKYLSQTELENKEFPTSKKQVFYIYSYTDNLCTDEVLRTVTIDLPTYNPYYHFNKEKCEGYSDFKYCKEFQDIQEMDFSEIDKLFEEYKDNKDPERKVENLFHQYIWYILGGVFALLVLLIGIIVFIKKRKNKEDI